MDVFEISQCSPEKLRSELLEHSGEHTAPRTSRLEVLTAHSFHTVFLLRQSGAISAALGLNIDREGIALLGPIVVSEPITDETRRALWKKGIDACLAQSVRALQLAADDTTNDRSILVQLGYPITTEIGLMSCPRIPQLVADDPGIERVSINEDLSRWTALVGQTFVDTLDLPEAISVRQPDLMVDGWRTEPDHNTWVATTPAGPVGLLVAHRNGETMEITYVGLIKSQRRQRWGTRLVGQFLKWCGENGLTTVTVMIDRRNEPAISLYHRFGFVEPQLWMPVVFHPVSLSGN